MVKFYIVQIQLGGMLIEDVPEIWRKRVEEKLEELQKDE